MKKSSLMLLCATSLIYNFSIAFAADDVTMPPPPHMEHHFNPEKHHEKMAKKLAEDLNLTEEQQAKAKEMRQNAREKIKPLIDERKAIREKMDSIRKENMKAFEELLTPEQKATFEKIKAERKARHDKMMKKHHHRPMPPLPME